MNLKFWRKADGVEEGTLRGHPLPASDQSTGPRKIHCLLNPRPAPSTPVREKYFLGFLNQGWPRLK